MNEIETIISEIEKLLTNNTPYSISKNSGVPRQTVTDLKVGKTKIKEAKFKTIIKLYEYQRTLENKQNVNKIFVRLGGQEIKFLMISWLSVHVLSTSIR